MALQCSRPERCHWCPPRAPRVQCWWIVTTGPWRLCHDCLEAAAGDVVV